MSSDKERPFGARADNPGEIPAGGWWEISKRIFAQLGNDHVSLVAAGVAFFSFLSIFPALSALASIYGLIVSPAEVTEQVGLLADILPAQAEEMLNGILVGITSSNDESLGWSLLFSLLLSVWSANKGTNALFEGLNIIYEERDKRSFIKRKLLTLTFTVGGFLGAILSLVLIVGISAFIGYLELPDWLQTLVSFARWPVLALVFTLALALIYKYAPHRENPELKWVSLGSIIAMILWIVLSIAFSLYVSNFSNYDEIYGSLAAVVITLLWLFLTSMIVLLGAEINAESEYQTHKDTTVGPDQPMGRRGAFYADHVPKSHRQD